MPHIVLTFNVNWIFLLTYSIIMEDFKIGESELKNLTFQFWGKFSLTKEMGRTGVYD